MFEDMCVLYAYMRLTDDLGDQPGSSFDQRREALRVWKNQLNRALSVQVIPDDPLWLAMRELVERRQIPQQLFLDVISGVESDLSPRRFADFIALQRYCYHVAGVVGLACLHVWGFDESAEARDLAITCGLAFQLTNILRDLGEDAQQGRVYIPQDILEKHGCCESAFLERSASNAVRSVVREMLDEAARLLEESRNLEPHLSHDGRRMFRAMCRTYKAIQASIVRADYDVLKTRASVPTWTVFQIIGSCLWNRWFGTA